MSGGILSKKALLLIIGTVILSGLLILGAYFYKFSSGQDSNLSEKPINSQPNPTSSGKTISLPFNIKSSSIKNPTILYRLSGKVVNIELNSEASASAWTIQPENPSDPPETLTIPWDRAITYQGTKPNKQSTIKDVKNGVSVELLISYNLQNNQKTVGQVLVKNP